MRTACWRGPWEATLAVQLLNQEPIAHPVGQSNEVSIIVDGWMVTTLINSGAQVSSGSSGFCEQMTLKVYPLDRLLELEGTEGSSILYFGYVEVNLQVPGIRGYNKADLLLVIPATTYSEKVPVMVGSKIIDRVMGIIMKGELVRATAKLKMPWGEGGSNEPTPLPHAEDALPINWPTESWLEGIPNSPSKQCKPIDPGSTGLTIPDSTHEGLYADNGRPVPLRWSWRTMRNQLPWRYQNFVLWQNNILPSAFNMWVALCICLHIMSCLYTVFLGVTVWRHSTWAITDLPDTNNFLHWWGHHWCSPYGGFLDGGSGPKELPHWRKSKRQLPIEDPCVSGQYNSEDDVHSSTIK